ncbi:HAD-IA family hydrolase [Bacillus suaedaesalsae]|uniref:HAD family hydrolase n=1 Tax=Bacillus suaedaesalsae TaxID=2810349 RepID=A0ABS2DM85_9BACI|nr:HAD family hydrolase [Bacillus suaedaesalsae]
MKAVIFDFDGLIIDTETVWYEVFRKVMGNYGVSMTVEDFSICIGTSDDVLYKKLEQLAGTTLDRTEMKRQTRELYNHYVSTLTLREGVIDYLQAATTMGLKLAVASSSSRNWVEAFLEKFQLRNYFDVVKTRDDVTMVKPDPELYIQAMTSLGVTAQEAFCFEDSKNGLQAALSAGLSCVIVPNGITRILDFSGHAFKMNSMADHSFEEVLAILHTKDTIHKGARS